MKTKPPLEAAYHNGEKYCRVHFHDLDRENIDGTFGGSMEKGRIVFLNAKGSIIARCEPKQLSWVRPTQAK